MLMQLEVTMSLRKYKRWNASRKAEVAIALLKGEPLEEVSRATGQPAHVLKAWKDAFLEGGAAAFQAGESARERAQEVELKSLKAKVGELVMDNDLLYEKIHRLEDGVPFHLRKSKH
jgi:transposase